MTIPVDDILEDLELPRAEAGPGYLERLFLRFNDRVPFETASKIVRNAAVAEPSARPRTPEIFWGDRLASGAGGTCFARVAAFRSLLDALGFRADLALGRVRADFDHAALFVETAGARWICDVGFPLPVLLPARSGRVETAVGALAVEETPGGFRIRFEGGVPAGPREVVIFPEPAALEDFRARWEATFRPDSSFLREVALHRLFDNRRATFVRGEIRVDDLHSRTRVPLAAPRTGVLEDLFGVDAGLLEAAFAVAGDPDPEEGSASVEVFLESPVAASEAFEAIASPPGYGRLLEGVAEVTVEATGSRSWLARLESPGTEGSPAGRIEESVQADPGSLTVSVRRNGRDSSYRAEVRDGAPWLIRRAALEGPRPDLLRNDSLRGRLAGSLAVDLLAWARRL